MRPRHEVVVIGAGPGGIAAGVALKTAGIADFALLERAEDLGGSWRDNTYPGIGVDIPSLAYQYSFARNPSWSRVFARGAEVQAYHRSVAQRYGLHKHLRTNTTVLREEWDEPNRLWRLHLGDGSVLTSRFVISAVGAFLTPKQDPGIPGLDEFGGKVQRPASWDHEHDLHGKRVAVIGTGASSVQITPAIAPEVAALDVYQRTPVWCLPKPDFTIPPAAQSVLRLPGVMPLLHGLMLGFVELLLWPAVYAPLPVAVPAMRLMDRSARAAYRWYLGKVVRDPAAREALLPSYGPLGKRPTLSNTFLRAFNRDNTRLVTTAIDRFTERGIRTRDGVEREYDVIVLATGYELFSDPESYRPGTVVGRRGFDLGEFYAENGLQAYESVSVPRLPNRWTLVGPYSWTGTGWHALVEITARHAVRVITEARRRGATAVEIGQRAHDAYHNRVRRHGRNIAHYFRVLNRGVRSYYLNSQGDVPYIRPSTVVQARWASRRFPLEHYEFRLE
ncbi:cation diffusion facilitator CzcD-associated flavoprotein CzcO [Kutzneria viridogrisea]|uniref:Cation diffusion facilitator CzcD-associated flavoprotein CzcO n=1 Tax=Kutzneria viridogrisea TaxID=47990 RepID=A0ABR6BKD3_9PSEU|nr:cation diffusion facilitator CzcD-associated flavoprotein CzcO [Kutzneria viridogrisea]